MLTGSEDETTVVNGAEGKTKITMHLDWIWLLLLPYLTLDDPAYTYRNRGSTFVKCISKVSDTLSTKQNEKPTGTSIQAHFPLTTMLTPWYFRGNLIWLANPTRLSVFRMSWNRGRPPT
jgi:hypothetical protein